VVAFKHISFNLFRHNQDDGPGHPNSVDSIDSDHSDIYASDDPVDDPVGGFIQGSADIDKGMFLYSGVSI
jgi:hypothetical protein